VNELKEIPGFPEYLISSNGDIWSKKVNRWLKSAHQKSGRYLTCTLYKNDKPTYHSVHKLILRAFVGECPKGMQCRHLNGNSKDNRLENLCWGTGSENQIDCLRHGTYNCGPFSEQDVRIVIYMWRTGQFTQREIADIYGVDKSAINRIINQKRWRHLWHYLN